MKKPERIKVERVYGELYIDGYTVPQIIEDFQHILKELNQQDVEPDDVFVDYTFAFDGGYDAEIKYLQLETDQEYEKRLNTLKRITETKRKAKVKKEEQERKEYERLKKKFEPERDK